MATLSGALTYADWAKRVDESGKIGMIVELLSQTNEILADMLVVEGNLPTGHKTTVRTGLPSGSWRLLNAGIPTTKSTTAQITATCGNLEAESQVDVDLVALNNDAAAFRLSESRAHFEGINQQMATQLIYGSEVTNAAGFTGLAPHYSSLSTATAQSAANVISLAGSGGDCTSIWIVTWGEQTCHGIFPKGKTAGLQHEDRGRWRVTDASGNFYWAYIDHYKWELGLALRDWRYCVRICNIDTTDLMGNSPPDLIKALVRGVRRLPTTGANATPVQTSDADTIQGAMGRTAIYCNRTVSTYLDIQAMNKTNVLLKMDEWDGKPVTTFRGIPIRTVDAILNTEATVS